MGISVLGAIAAAGTAIMNKASDPQAGWIVVTLAIAYPAAVIVAFFLRNPSETGESEESAA